jgi:hypothetical protein
MVGPLPQNTQPYTRGETKKDKGGFFQNVFGNTIEYCNNMMAHLIQHDAVSYITGLKKSAELRAMRFAGQLFVISQNFNKVPHDRFG